MKSGLIFLFCLQLIGLSLSTPLIWPLPKQLNSTAESAGLSLSASDFTFSISSSSLTPTLTDYLQELVLKYQQLIFSPKSIPRYYSQQPYDFSYKQGNGSKFVMLDSDKAFFNLTILNTTTVLRYNISESYSLNITNSTRTITADTYFGFVRALQTISQLITRTETDIFHQIWTIECVPIMISDSPDFMHRGAMLDPSRHFLPMADVLRTIDALSYAKMNVLHLHLTDSNSFSTWVNDYPEITKFGAFYYSEYYSQEDLELLVSHGTLMGVRIIPEYDSPGHTRAWGLSPNLKPMIACEGLRWGGHAVQPPCGQLDPLVEPTYQVVKSVAEQCNQLFPDEVMHWGGDEVNQGCWDAKDTISEAIRKEGVQTIESKFVEKQRQILKDVNETKRAMYWVQGPVWKNEGDILQHWGGATSLDDYLKFKEQYLVVSSVDTLYMDCGLGNLFGSDSWCGTYKDFLTILNTNFKVTESLQYIVLGGEACMWGELVNSGSVDNKLWGRLSALSEKLWNHQYYSQDLGRLKQMRNIIPRLAKFEKMLMERGISVTPVTTDFCASNVEICFNE